MNQKYVASGRVTDEAKSFRLRSAGPDTTEYNPAPRYADGRVVERSAQLTAQEAYRSGVGIYIGDKRKIIERHEAGETIEQLAAAYRTSKKRIREIINLTGSVDEIEVKADVEVKETAPKSNLQRKRDDITEEMVQAWVVAHKIDKTPIAHIAKEGGFSEGLVFGRITRYIYRNPEFLRQYAAAKESLL